MVRESGWNTVKLKDICDFIGGGTPSKQVENFWCGNIPWISSSDLIESSIWKINITRHITAEAVAKSATHICPRNTVLVVSRVGVGKVAIAPFEVCTSQDFTNLVSKKHDARFLAYCIQNKMKIMAEKTQGTSIKGVTVENIAQMEIELPPQEEQTAIAEALSDVDSLTSSLQKLIEKKKAIKQGAMQELLTGKKRLPGFSEEWAYRRVGEICSITKGQIITEKTAIHGNVPVIAGGKTHAFYHNVANRESDVITISASGANAGYIAYHDYPIFASDCSTIESSDQYDVKFIYYALLYHQQELIGMQTGGAQPHIHPKEIGVLLVPRINQEEQRAIANVLSDMDSEIEQLEKKLAKYQQIKQGMMQELLTGRIRLV